MKFIFISVLVLLSIISSAQRPSETVKDKELYGSDTKWSCVDKHFGYYYINYSMPLPLVPSIENEFKSGYFTAGYTYRYKFFSKLDLGFELAYINRRSNINNDSLTSFDPSDFYNKINTYHNYLSGGAYIRMNLGNSTYRNLGIFTDIGGFYNYAFGYGTKYVLKSNSLYQKLRFRKPDYLTPYDYGIFLRIGYNNIAVMFNYSLGKWITDFSSENKNYIRSGFLIGLQINLYAK